MPSVLRKIAGKSLTHQAGFLEFCSSPEKFYCPFAIKDLAEVPEGIFELPMTMDEWGNLTADYFVPTDTAEKLRDPSQYASGVRELAEMRVSGRLVPRAVFTDEEAGVIQEKFMPFIRKEHRTLEFLDFYVRPEEYYCPFVKGENITAEAEKLTYPPEFLSEWQKLESRWILPSVLVAETFSAETYNEAVRKIVNMSADGQLIPSEAGGIVRKRAEKCKSVDEYRNLSYRKGKVKS